MISTSRLDLLPPQQSDLPWLLEAINTEPVMRYLGGEIRSEGEVADMLAADIDAFVNGGHRRWTVWLRAANRRVGRCGLFTVRTEAAPAELRGQPEIGWTFAVADWGHGYATEAARAVLQFGFEDLQFPAIYSQTSDSNQASTRMMQRLGLERCPQLDYVDPGYPPRDNPTTVYRLTREAFGP